MRATEEIDPGTVPVYSVPQAAHYVGMPTTTLRSWVRGRSYPVREGEAWSDPLTVLPGEARRLCFYNLVEAHMLSAFRWQAGVQMGRIRLALQNLRTRFANEQFPFATRAFITDGATLFLEEAEGLIDLSAPNQRLIEKAIRINARRVRWANGRARLFFPLTRQEPESPRRVVIDPRIGFGRPTVEGVSTAVLVERFRAGESLGDLSNDYGLTVIDIEEAIRCESWERAA